MLCRVQGARIARLCHQRIMIYCSDVAGPAHGKAGLFRKGRTMKTDVRRLLILLLLAVPCRAGAADAPDRTVGPQNDGSVLASSNQMLTPAGTVVNLGSPV